MITKKQRRTGIEIMIAIIFIGIFWHLLQEHTPKILEILESGNAQKIDSYLMQYGTEGRYLLVLLQIIETVSIVLPAIPVYICSGIMFGKVQGILICYSVNLILNLIIFLTARKFRKSTQQLYDPGRNKLIGKMLQGAKHTDRVVLIMCFLPVVPNGMIPYMSAQMPVTAGAFLRTLAIGSLPSIIIYVCCGDILMSESYRIMAPILVILIILSVLLYVFRKKLTAFLEPKLLAFIGA